MERCSTSPIIREMHIKPTMRYQLTPVRMAVTKKSTTKKSVHEGVEKIYGEGTRLESGWWAHNTIHR